MKGLLKAIFGTKQDRDVKALQPLIKEINGWSDVVRRYTESDFKSKTKEFRDKLAKGEVTLNSILPEAFAMVREVAERTLSMRHYDVQLLGGLVLTNGKIAEMKTGEGKTLTGTLSAYIRALENKGVHIVTVNDYLAKRDCEALRPLYEYFGLTVDCIDVHTPHSQERRKAYDADITFGTNNEFGFDFLRDNMVTEISQKVVQRPYHFCIIDEVDSILIDEARTPLIISGPSESNVSLYTDINKIIPKLKKAEVGADGKEVKATGDFFLDIKDRNIYLTEEGVEKVEALLSIESLHALQNMEVLHHVNQALRAHKTMERDVDYIIENGEVVIIDEFTGRKMEGRRFSDGLHQAIEAKERVTVQNENQTFASITFQNFFRMYHVVSGMTGTADTEAFEFKKIYNLEVIIVPTNQPMIRIDKEDKVYRTKKEKYRAITERVMDAHEKGQPVLVGTLSVESSEELSAVFKKQKITHEVLNAKNHAREAIIVEKAGQRGSVTIATSMAGRGTDIKLGSGVVDIGGLLIVGAERAESRRVDNQLRGRSGRQGDPGESQFYLSLEDDLMRRFGSERISNMMLRLGMEEGEEIQHSLITRSIEGAQKKVEMRNFDIRKHLLEYDDVMNQQRQNVYKQRNYFLAEKDLNAKVYEISKNAFAQMMYEVANENEEVHEELYMTLNIWLKQQFSIDNWLSKDEFLKHSYEELEEIYVKKVEEHIEHKFKGHPPEVVLMIQRNILLSVLDSKWKDHLHQMDQLREGIFLRSYAEKKPLTEFKNEGYKIFTHMFDTFSEDVVTAFMRVQFEMDARSVEMMRPLQGVKENHSSVEDFFSPKNNAPLPTQAVSEKTIGRNELCLCGSGKKYKNCCGKL